jgi:N-acetylneuraminate lyase
MMMTELNGLTPAVLTPMDADGAIALGVVGDYTDRLIASGVGGIFVCGTTGEFPSLTIAERHDVAAAFMQAAGGRIPVGVHVGANDLSGARALASHAAQIGADFIATTPPCFLMPEGIDGVIDWCQRVTTEVPELPFYYYHFPSMSGVELDMLAFLRAAESRLPSLAGIKFTHGALDEYAMCLDEFGDRLDILFGRDEMLLAGLAVGATGAIGSGYNFAMPLYRALWNAFEAGDVGAARTCQCVGIELIRTLVRYGYFAGAKHCMKLIGLDVGQPRAPLGQLSAEQQASLTMELDALGFFDWAMP